MRWAAVERRTYLRACGAATVTGLGGCQTLADVYDRGVDPRWTRGFGAVSSAAPFEGLLYVTTDSRTIRAINPGNGNVWWRRSGGLDVTGAAGWLFLETESTVGQSVQAYAAPFDRVWTVDGGFVAADDTRVYLRSDRQATIGASRTMLEAVDRETGSAQWRVRLGSDPGLMDMVARDELYLAVGDHTGGAIGVYRIDGATGTVRWTESLGPGVLPAVGATPDRVVVGIERAEAGQRPTVTALTPDGEMVWRHAWDGYHTYPAWVGGDTAVVSVVSDAGGGRVVGIDASDGRVEWSTRSALVAVHDDRVYTYRDGTIRARRPGDGGVDARYRLGTWIDPAAPRPPAVVVGSDVIWCTVDRSVLAIAKDGGGLRWRIETGRPARIVAVDRSTVYVATSTRLIALPRTVD